MTTKSPTPAEKLIAALDAANKALAEVPFTSWPNNYLKDGIFSALEALQYDHKDPRGIVALSIAIFQLQKQLGERIQRNYSNNPESQPL